MSASALASSAFALESRSMTLNTVDLSSKEISSYRTDKEAFEMDEQDLTIGSGSYPCVFKLGTSVYDYTPFKLYQQTWFAVNGTVNITSQSFDIDTVWDWGWCQKLDDAQGANCTGDMYAGSYPYENWVN